jgi:uncharacterized protein (TIGR00299 family) protein
MNNTAYLDCFSGVSGNMLLGALLDVGFPEDILRETLAALPVTGFQLDVEQVDVNGFTAHHVQVSLEQEQPHRHLQDIKDILAASTLAERIKKQALAVFTRLAEAEGAVHGVRPEEVHFHEVGAVDALVDVVGGVAGFNHLQVDKICCSPLPMPGGWIQCAHGEIPLPAPAVLNLLQDVPVYGVELKQELVTPTGAALVCELASGFGPMPTMTLQASGYGAGTRKREDGRPNLLRICLGHDHAVDETHEVEILETHLDDWNSETWPYVSEQLMTAGALDVSLTPVLMKKGRPGYVLKVICEPSNAFALKTCIFSETTTIGLRFQRQQRMTLPRKTVMVKTPWGEAQGKEVETPVGTVITPEYESCKELARQEGVSLQDIYHFFVESGPQT